MAYNTLAGGGEIHFQCSQNGSGSRGAGGFIYPTVALKAGDDGKGIELMNRSGVHNFFSKPSMGWNESATDLSF